MTLVIDSSALLYELASADGVDALAHANDLVAPALLWSEVTSVINETRWRGELSAELATLMLDRFLAAPIGRRQGADLYRHAQDVSRRLGWAKTYDAEFVALALSLTAPLYTRDARLARRVDELVEVPDPADISRSSGS